MKKTTIELPIEFDENGGEAWAILDMDCESGQCPDVDKHSCKYSRFQMPTQEVLDCRKSRRHVKHCYIESIEINAFDGKLEYTYNGWIDGDDVYATRAEAEAALAEIGI